MIHIPFVDLKHQRDSIQKELNHAINSVFDNGNFILGEQCAIFQTAFCEYLGDGYGIGVNSGTDALYLALMAEDIGPGDEVITVAHTFMATYIAITHTGAKAVLVDIDPETFNIDPKLIEASISPKTRAIIPVHLYGRPAPMQEILEIAQKHELIVIEDACQAHGAHIENIKVGLWGRYGCFSFYPTKNLGAYGDGGMVVTKTPELADKLRALRNYGQSKKYHHDTFGLNSRLDEMQAAILGVKLKYLDSWNDARRKIAQIYCEQIESNHLKTPIFLDNTDHVFHLFVVTCHERDLLKKHLESRGVHSQIHYPVPVHRQQCYINRTKSNYSLPVTERVCNKILSLPMYPELSEQQIDYVINAVNMFKC